MKVKIKKKKFIAILLILSLVVQNLLFNYTDRVFATTTGTVTANTLYVRTGPSTSSSHVVVKGSNVYLTKGAKVPILSTKGSFYYVSLTFSGKAVKGYVHKDYVKVTSAQSTPTPKPSNTSVSGGITGTVTTASLTVRSGAGTTYGVTGGLVKNDAVKVLGDVTNGSEKWYKISVNKSNKVINGYVSGYYVKLSYSKAISAQILASKVNVSTTAGSTTYLKNKSKAIITLNKGKSISVKNEATSGGVKWYQISFSDNGTTYTGYVKASAVTLKATVTPAPTPTKKPIPTPTKKPNPTPTKKPTPTSTPSGTTTTGLPVNGTVTASSLVVRSGAGTGYKSINSIPKNTGVTIVSDVTYGSEKWYKISTIKSGQTVTGFVSGYYVKISYNKALNAQIIPSKVKVSITAGSSSFIKDSSNKVIELSQGQNITVKNEAVSGTYKWYQVSFTSGGKNYSGYLQASNVTFKASNTSTPTKKPTPTPTKKPTPTNKPTPTPTKKPTPTPTKKPTPTPTKRPTLTPTNKPTPTPIPTTGLPVQGMVTASSLKVRSGAGTNYSSISSVSNSDVITILSDVTYGDEKWYKISTVQGGKTITGYVSGYYVKLSYTKALAAQTLPAKVKVSITAGSSAYVKNANKDIELSKGQNILVIGEALVGEYKWYQISFTYGGATCSGFLQACNVTFINSNTPANPTTTPTPTKSPTMTPTPTKSPNPTNSPNQGIPPVGTIFEVAPLDIFEKIDDPVTGYICNTDFVFNVFDYKNSNLTYMNDSSGKPIKLSSAQVVTVTQFLMINYVPYYKVNFIYGGVQKTGYVMPSVVYIPSKSNMMLTSDNNSTYAITPTKAASEITVAALTDSQFENALTKEGFPESYKVYLRMLHDLYPQWVFEAYQTGLDWDSVITAESKVGLNLIPNYKGMEWLSMEGKAYNWSTDKFTVYDGSTWVTASKAAIGYYMDPRNFLTTNGIFQFELLKYQSEYQGIDGVYNILKNSPFNSSYNFTNNYGLNRTYSYAETFMKAALYSGVSPYHLASRSKQEVMSSSSSFSGSATGTYSGYQGYYNFYNIGASNSAGGGAVANGLSYAKNGTSSDVTNTQYMLPWNNRFKSITGGAFWIGSRYINRGQDTVYLQKFNMTDISRYSHQYMANVEAPYAEAKKVKTAYSTVLDTPIVFSIPVYKNMPSSPVATPAPMKNPNNRMKSLTVTDGKNTLGLSPSFDQTVKTYSISVDNKVLNVTVTATAVSSEATVSGTGSYPLAVGKNKITVTVKAEDGSPSTYTINIERKK